MKAGWHERVVAEVRVKRHQIRRRGRGRELWLQICIRPGVTDELVVRSRRRTGERVELGVDLGRDVLHEVVAGGEGGALVEAAIVGRRRVTERAQVIRELAGDLRRRFDEATDANVGHVEMPSEIRSWRARRRRGRRSGRCAAKALAVESEPPAIATASA